MLACEPQLRSTDWDRYHQRVPTLAKLTRRYTRSALMRALRRHAAPARKGVILELGGANSFFVESIVREFAPREYHVVDTNESGLRLLERRSSRVPLIVHRHNVLSTPIEIQADVVFSIGLIEHFSGAARRDAILAHVRTARQGGCVIISFPIPTVSYRITRAVAERSGSWLFHDEAPVRPAEVANELADQAVIIEQRTLWPVVLTQHMIVGIRK